MRGTGIGTSLMMIAIGAVLAFAVNLQTTGIDLNVIGAILMVVGIIGLLISLVMLGEFSLLGPDRTHGTTTRRDVIVDDHTHVTDPPVNEVIREERTRRY